MRICGKLAYGCYHRHNSYGRFWGKSIIGICLWLILPTSGPDRLILFYFRADGFTHGVAKRKTPKKLSKYAGWDSFEDSFEDFDMIFM